METVEKVGSVLVPCEMKQVADGEAFQFDHDKAMKALLTPFRLDYVVRERSVDLSIAMDGAQLKNCLRHLMTGVKIRDHAALDPITDQPVFAGENSFVQSCDLCFLLHMHMGNETKEKYQTEFEDYFEYFRQESSTYRFP